MEELRTTEHLDHEILEDARKKAERILRSADKAIAEADTEWNAKATAELSGLELRYRERSSKSRSELMATLALDRRRVRSLRADRLLSGSIEALFRELPRSRQLFLLERNLREQMAEVARDLRVIRAEPPSVTARALTEAEARSLLNTVPLAVPGLSGVSLKLRLEASSLPSLTIVLGLATVTASLGAIAESLLDDYRAELASALLGAEALDD